MCRRRFGQAVAARTVALLSIPVSGLIPAVSLAQPIEDPAAGWDELWNKVMIDITILGVFFALVTLYFMFKYRRRHPDETGRAPRLSVGMAIGWVVIPTFAFMADDFFLAAKGWQLSSRPLPVTACSTTRWWCTGASAGSCCSPVRSGFITSTLRAYRTGSGSA